MVDRMVLLSSHSAPVGERSIVINPSAVCLSLSVCVCLSASISLKPPNRSSRNFVCGSPVPWLGPPVAALRYVMYFRVMDDVTCGVTGATPKRGGCSVQRLL